MIPSILRWIRARAWALLIPATCTVETKGRKIVPPAETCMFCMFTIFWASVVSKEVSSLSQTTTCNTSWG